jgi:pantoate--beta-alanine ligase
LKLIETIDEMRAVVYEWRGAGDSIAFVPTMGNLHKGHVSLARLAAENAERVIVSVFVNPTQFGPNEDYEKYPRTLEVDTRKLSRAKVDVLFAPTVDEMYPHGHTNSTQVVVPELSDMFCGEYRPGHFVGVTSVVSRLLNICMPDIAIFGEKDYQQFKILQRMVDDLQMPVRLLAGPTERDANGLALSSRNSFLDEEQQATAAVIQQSLLAVASRLRDGQRNYAELEQEAMQQIEAAGLEPEFVAIRGAGDLAEPADGSMRIVVLAAARYGDVRLIDNLLVKLV